MNKKRFFSILLFSLLIIGCTRVKIDELKPTVNSSNAVTIDLFNNKSAYKLGPVNMSEFVDSVRFITLEETDESLIKQIHKVFFISEMIVVVDRELNTIFFFDREGKYLRKISKRGQGPGEYRSILSCMYDEQKQHLIIYDLAGHKILFYDLYGNFVKGISDFCENTIIRDIINLPNGHFLCYTFDLVGQVDEKYTGLWEVDAEGKFLRNYFTYNVVLPIVHVNASYFQQLPNETISLRDNTHNDIYHYRNGKVERYISYNIIGSRLTELIGTTRAGEKGNVKASIDQDKGDFIITLWLDETYPRHQTLFSLYSKKNKKVRYWDAFHSYDAAVPGVMSWLIESNNNVLVCMLNRDIIDGHLSDQNLPESARNSLTSLLQEIGTSENPVLELLFIKK